MGVNGRISKNYQPGPFGFRLVRVVARRKKKSKFFLKKVVEKTRYL